MAQMDAPVRFVWTTNGRVRRVDEPITPERLEAIARLLERASAAFKRKEVVVPLLACHHACNDKA